MNRLLALATVGVVLTAAQAAAGPIIVVDSPFAGSGGDFLTRGFYVQNYGATNLSTVELHYSAATAGVYTTSLTARLGAYNGPVIGATQVTTTLPLVTAGQAVVVYDFGGAPIPFGSTVTFTQAQLSGPGSVFYDVGTTPLPGLFETQGTTPPLDTFRRPQVGVRITANAPIPEPATLVVFGALAGAGGLAVRRRSCTGPPPK